MIKRLEENEEWALLWSPKVLRSFRSGWPVCYITGVELNENQEMPIGFGRRGH